MESLLPKEWNNHTHSPISTNSDCVPRSNQDWLDHQCRGFIMIVDVFSVLWFL